MQGGLRENDFIEHFFVASTKAYLLCFTDKGQAYWLKVYNIPQANRTSPGRSIANVLSLKQDEKIASVIPVREFEPGSFLLMATRQGLVKKTDLMEYSRPRAGGIIGINLEEGDALIDVCLTKPGDEVVLSTQNGMAIRFSEADARSMGRNTTGVWGIKLVGGDVLVGMVVADPDGFLLKPSARKPVTASARRSGRTRRTMPATSRRKWKPRRPPRPAWKERERSLWTVPPCGTAANVAAAKVSATSRPPTATARSLPWPPSATATRSCSSPSRAW